MLKKLRQSWHRFKAGSPGRRFQQQFSRRQRSRHGFVQRAFFIGGGILLAAGGVFLLFVPGPGLLLLLLGAILIAQQSLLAARVLDWAEVRIRKLLFWSMSKWDSSSPALKILLLALAVFVVGAVAFGAFKLWIANSGFGRKL